MKYRVKDNTDVVVEAFQWTGGEDQTEDPIWIVDEMKAGRFVIEDGVGWIRIQEEIKKPVTPYDFIVLRDDLLFSMSSDLFNDNYVLLDE